MRRVLGALALLVLVFAGVLVVRALALRSVQPKVAAAPRYPIADERETLERLAAAIRIQTVSHQDEAQNDPAAFQAFRAHLERSFPKLHARLTRELIAEHSLLYRW